jgi:F-type H+-transporting ATPase subunit a
MVKKTLKNFINSKYMLNEIILNSVFDVAEVSVGQHYYWEIGGYSVHGQVLMTTWFVFAIIAIIAFAGNSNLKSIPEGLQNLTEYITEFIRDLAKTQIGEEEYEMGTVLELFSYLFSYQIGLSFNSMAN